MKDFLLDMLKAPKVLYYTYKKDKITHKVLTKIIGLEVLYVISMSSLLISYYYIRDKIIQIVVKEDLIMIDLIILFIIVISTVLCYEYTGKLLKPYLIKKPKEDNK